MPEKMSRNSGRNEDGTSVVDLEEPDMSEGLS